MLGRSIGIVLSLVESVTRTIALGANDSISPGHNYGSSNVNDEVGILYGEKLQMTLG